MELTGLKAIVNSGGGFTDNTGSSYSSKTSDYKKIKNLPGFVDGTPGSINISSFSPAQITKDWGSYAQMPTTTLSPSIANPSAILTFNAASGGTGEYTSAAKNAIGLGLTQLVVGGQKVPTKGGGFNGAGVGNLILSGILFTGDTINAFSVNETGDEILKRQGQTQMSIGGVDYESQNSIDISKELEQVKKENTGNTLKTVGSGAALGAAAGSVIPGLGTAAGAVIGAGVGLITGIFGGEARKRKYRLMLAKLNSMINALLDSSRFSAQTKAIQLQNAKEYGNSEFQYLYGAKNGMLPKYNNGTPSPDLSNIQKIKPGLKLADSTFGKVDAFNSYASNGEVAEEDGVIRKLGKGKDNNDTLPFFATGKTAIFPNKGEEKYGIDISDFVWKTGDVNTGLLMLKDYQLNMNKNSMYAKNGRLPKYKIGTLGLFNPYDIMDQDGTFVKDSFVSPFDIIKQTSNKSSKLNINLLKNRIAPWNSADFASGVVDPYAINKKLLPSAEYINPEDTGNAGKWFTSPLDNLPYYFNMASALGHSLFRDRRISTPNTEVAAPRGLEELYALNINPYPILLNNIKILDKTKKAIQMSGGLNAAQKSLAYMMAQYNTQLNNSKALADALIQNNAYKSDATKTRLSAESAYDQRRVAQDNLKYDALATGHGNSQLMDILDLTTISTAAQNASKNAFNGRLYRWMMDQYAQELKAKRKNGRWII